MCLAKKIRCAGWKEQQGIALLEALIAAAIIAIGLLMLGQFQSRLIQVGAESRAASEAVYIAQTKLDELRALPIEDVSEDGSPEEVEGTAGRIYTVSWTLDQPAGAESNLVSVTAFLEGSGVNGPPIQATLHSFLADRTFLALSGENLEGAGEGTFTPEKYVEGAYEQVTRTPDGTLDLDLLNEERAAEETGAPRFESVPGDLAFAVGEGGAVVEIASLRSGDSLLLGEGGYARVSGNLIFAIDGADEAASDPFLALEVQLGAGSGAAEKVSLFDQLISVQNGICSVFPTYQDLEPPGSDSIGLLVDGGDKYRVLGYSCYVANRWFGSINAAWPQDQAGNTRDICTGNPDSEPELDPVTGEWCDPDNPDAACSLLKRASVAGDGRLGRAYIGFRPCVDQSGNRLPECEGGGVVEVNEDGETVDYLYDGVKGSPVFGQAEYGGVCGTQSMAAKGPLSADCAVQRELAALLVPGGHHFLVTDLPSSVTIDGAAIEPAGGELARWVGCKQAMERFDDLASYVNNPYTNNPSRFVCLTPETCVYLPRFSGFIVNEAASVVDGQDLVVRWQRGGLTIPRFCNTFGEFGTESGIYWCLVDDAILGSVDPESPGLSFDPTSFAYQSRDGQGPLPLRKSWATGDISTQRLFALDFTSRDTMMATIAGGDGDTGGGADPDPPPPTFYTISGSVSRTAQNLNIRNVTIVAGNGAQCTKINFGNSGGGYRCSVPVGWGGSISLGNLPNKSSSSPTLHGFSDVEADDLDGNDFVVSPN